MKGGIHAAILDNVAGLKIRCSGWKMFSSCSLVATQVRITSEVLVVCRTNGFELAEMGVVKAGRCLALVSQNRRDLVKNEALDQLNMDTLG